MGVFVLKEVDDIFEDDVWVFFGFFIYLCIDIYVYLYIDIFVYIWIYRKIWYFYETYILVLR